MEAWTGYYLHARSRDFMLRKAPCSKASGKASEWCRYCSMRIQCSERGECGRQAGALLLLGRCSRERR
jgi:hypothetical protein